MVSSKNAKNSKTLEVIDDNDRISNLPDEILSHILSFLNTKHAVATTILSRRWKFLFTTVPNLDFDDFLTPQRYHYTLFVSFVYRVLLLHDRSDVSKLRLRSMINYDESHVSSWICAVLRRNVRELEILIPMIEFSNLPSDVFICKTLVVLTISRFFVLNVPSQVCLPNLKVLHLDKIKFKDDDSIRRVFSNCPMLDELRLNECEMENIKNLDITIRSLKSLVMDQCEGSYTTIFDTPSLECLDYTNEVSGGYTVKNLNSLVEAHISVGWNAGQLKEEAQYVAKFVKEVSNVKFLYLSGGTLEALEYSGCLLPTFDNLTQLELGLGCNGWKLLPSLLESSPNLEALRFVMGFTDCMAVKAETPYYLPESVPVCLSQHLKEIEIQAFCEEEDELKLIEYFLKNGEVLKKMIVKFEPFPEPEWISCTRKQLLMFQRCSQTCQIVVS